MKLSFKAVEGHEKYLGLPTYLGEETGFPDAKVSPHLEINSVS